MKMLKKTLSIILLSIFSFNTGGFFLLFKIQQLLVIEEMKERIKQTLLPTELTLIRIDTKNHNEIEWENKNEFRYKGEMYDVVSTKTCEDGQVAYYCINDQKETTLFRNLDEQVKKNRDAGDKENNQAKVLLNLLSSIYCLPSAFSLMLSQNSQLLKPGGTLPYLPPVLDVSSPPPKLV